MIQSNLVLHRGARQVDIEELDNVPCPPSTDTWFPVSHGTVLTTVSESLTGAGFAIDRMELALSRDDARFFGTLRLKNRINDHASLAVGIRNSVDKSFPIGFCCGSSVFCCDNLAFASEIVIARRHTKFGEQKFNSAVCHAVVGLSEYQATASQRISALQAWELPPETADSLLLRSFETGIISSRLLPAVITAWRNPSHVEFQPRNGWSLLNAFTGVLKDRQKKAPQEASLQTIRLQRLLAPPEEFDHGVIDAQSTPAG